MTGITGLLSGDAVPIELQISDGSTGLYPRAEIYINGVYNSFVNLTHINNGLYRYSGYFMPANDIAITYIVYTTNAYTVESNYDRDIDIFKLGGGAAPTVDQIADGVWDEDLTTHTNVDSTGAALIDVLDESTGKWILNPTTNTMTLYRADGVTVLKTFNLGSTTDEVSNYISRTPV